MFLLTTMEYNSWALSKKLYMKSAIIYKYSQPDARVSMAIDF